MLELAAPDPLHGQRLRQELSAAGVDLGLDDWSKADGVLRFHTLDEGVRDTVEQVVADHIGEPLPDPDEEWLDAISNTGSWQELRDLLAGKDPDVPGHAARTR